MHSNILKRLLKQAIFVFVNVCLWRIVLYVLGKLHSSGLTLFNYIFFIYPGTERNLADIEEYCPSFLIGKGPFAKKIVLCGLIAKGPGGRGLVVGTFTTTLGFIKNKSLITETYNNLESLRSKIGAKSIALAGQLPGLFLRGGTQRALC